MSYLNSKQSSITKEARMKIRALNHPLRQQILELIKSRGNRVNVTDLYKTLRIEQSVASMQLGLLRQGKVHFYWLHLQLYLKKKCTLSLKCANFSSSG